MKYTKLFLKIRTHDAKIERYHILVFHVILGDFRSQNLVHLFEYRDIFYTKSHMEHNVLD